MDNLKPGMAAWYLDHANGHTQPMWVRVVSIVNNGTAMLQWWGDDNEPFMQATYCLYPTKRAALEHAKWWFEGKVKQCNKQLRALDRADAKRKEGSNA
jgi:hypothetical protein